LIEQWELSSDEVDHIDLQQGFCCTVWKNNLRPMTLAAAMTKAFGFAGRLKDFCHNDRRIRKLTVIEITAGRTRCLRSSLKDENGGFMRVRNDPMHMRTL
jgi:hypothetical protein